MSRMYPKYPIVAVGIVLVDFKNKRVLLIKRGNEPGKGLWSIPGGVVELGEKLIHAAKRELKEETGLECEVLGVFHIDQVIIRDEHNRIKWHYILIDVLAEPIGGTLKPSSDVMDAKWLSIEEAFNMKLTNATRRMLKRLSRMLEEGKVNYIEVENE